jgi:hypothetical protein
MQMIYQADGLEVIEQSNEEDDVADQAEFIHRRKSRRGSSGRSNVTASFLSGDQGLVFTPIAVSHANNGIHTDKLGELSVD